MSLRAAPDVIRQVYQGATDADGAAEVTFTVPEDLPSTADLVIETRSPAGEAQIVRPIRIARAYKIYLSSDKPAYRPGHTLHLRALVLDAADFTPATGKRSSSPCRSGGTRRHPTGGNALRVRRRGVGCAVARRDAPRRLHAPRHAGRYDRRAGRHRGHLRAARFPA